MSFGLRFDSELVIVKVLLGMVGCLVLIVIAGILSVLDFEMGV